MQYDFNNEEGGLFMIALITSTGSRPDQFNLCQEWMRRQTYQGIVVWIIIDDALPISTNNVNENFRQDWNIIKIYPKPTWIRGQNTQARNIEAGINYLETNCKDVEAVFIIEDDDYYKPQYLERMMSRSVGMKVWGEINSVYYNVLYRNYFINRNISHSSLFQLAFKPEMIPLFRSCLNHRFIDFNFYEKLHRQLFVSRGEVGFFNESNLAIGMKGMPGRAGIGAGHTRLMNMLPDPQMSYLRSQIQDDAKHYEGYYGHRSFAKSDILTKKRF